MDDNQGQAWAAFSNDAGRTWGTPIPASMTPSSLGRVDVELLDDGSAVALWIEFANGRSRAADAPHRDVRARARRPSTVSAVGDARASGYPRLARAGNELLFAWTESTPDGEMSVRTAVANLP